MKKSSALNFMMNISFVPSIYIHRSIILIFIQKKYACRSFSMENIFSAIFDFQFCENPRFSDEFLAQLLHETREKDQEQYCSSPAMMFLLAMIMTAVMPTLKMAFCPQFSRARLVVVFSDAFSYSFKCTSYLSASYFSLLKYCNQEHKH